MTAIAIWFIVLLLFLNQEAKADVDEYALCQEENNAKRQWYYNCLWAQQDDPDLECVKPQYEDCSRYNK